MHPAPWGAGSREPPLSPAHLTATKITHNNVITFPTSVHNLIDTMTESDVILTSLLNLLADIKFSSKKL